MIAALGSASVLMDWKHKITPDTGKLQVHPSFSLPLRSRIRSLTMLALMHRSGARYDLPRRWTPPQCVLLLLLDPPSSANLELTRSFLIRRVHSSTQADLLKVSLPSSLSVLPPLAASSLLIPSPSDRSIRPSFLLAYTYPFRSIAPPLRASLTRPVER